MLTSLLKSTVDAMAPPIPRLADLSFSTGVFPSALKCGRVSTLLKKPGLDQADMANFRPITNVPTVSKILAKLVLACVRPHVMSTGNFSSEFQSVYRAGHSAETALLKVINDVVMATCRQEATVLISLDISAAFDTVVHSVLLDHALNDFGIDGVALAWLRSFITGRTHMSALEPVAQKWSRVYLASRRAPFWGRCSSSCTLRRSVTLSQHTV